MNEVEGKVLDAIDVEELLTTISKLIEIPSVTGEEAEAQRFVASLMREIGLEVDMWDIDLKTLRKHPDFSMEVDRKEGIGVVGRAGRGKGRSLILNGHTDVVSPGDESNWRHPPWKGTEEGGRLYGRGAVDMKGGLCCALQAVNAVKKAGVELNGRLLIESVVGEEDGGVGTLASILRGYMADGAIIMEPTDLKVAPAQAGAHCFRITIQGRSAHACVREEGVSSLEKFMPIHDALLGLEKRRNEAISDDLYARYRLPIPLNIGTVRCGDWPSSVPEKLMLEGRYGIWVDENVSEAHEVFEEAVASAANSDDWLREHPPEVEWWGGQFNPARTPVSHPIVTTLSNAYGEATDAQSTFEGVTYGSDMRHLVNLGKIPTVLFGPGDVRLCHCLNENVPIDDLIKATRTYALTIMRYCGVEP